MSITHHDLPTLASAVLDAAIKYSHTMAWGECTSEARPVEARTKAALERVRTETGAIYRLADRASRARSRRPAILAEMSAARARLVAAADEIVDSGWDGATQLIRATTALREAPL